jgi:hypothetical protein
MHVGAGSALTLDDLAAHLGGGLGMPPLPVAGPAPQQPAAGGQGFLPDPFGLAPAIMAALRSSVASRASAQAQGSLFRGAHGQPARQAMGASLVPAQSQGLLFAPQAALPAAGFVPWQSPAGAAQVAQQAAQQLAQQAEHQARAQQQQAQQRATGGDVNLLDEALGLLGYNTEQVRAPLLARSPAWPRALAPRPAGPSGARGPLPTSLLGARTPSSLPSLPFPSLSRQVSYTPEERLTRASAKLFNRTPAALPPDLRASLQNMLTCGTMEGFLRQAGGRQEEEEEERPAPPAGRPGLPAHPPPSPGQQASSPLTSPPAFSLPAHTYTCAGPG